MVVDHNADFCALFPFSDGLFVVLCLPLKMGCDGGEVEKQIICLFNMWATIPRGTVSD